MTFRKAQTWFLDYTLAFTFIIIIMFMVLHLLPDFKESDFVQYQKETYALSDIIFSEGVPLHWNAGNVVRPGLLNSSGRLDQDRIDEFQQLEYSDIKTFTGITGDFDINFTYVNGTVLDICENCTSSTDDYDYLATVRRLAVYNGTIIIVQVSVFGD